MVLDPRHYQKRKKRAEVNRPIERAVGFLQQVRLLWFELIANESRDEGLIPPEPNAMSERPV